LIKMNEKQKNLLNDFLKEGKLGGYREQHLIGLRSRVPKLFAFLNEKGLCIEELGAKDALEYQGWLLETGRRKGGKYRNNTILSYLGAAGALCEYLKRKSILLSNPFREIRKVRADKKIPRDLLKEKEMNHFLCELSHFEREKDLKNKITRYKVHVIAELMYATGLRISEVAALTLDSIDFTRGIVTVVDGKKGKSRIAFLNDYAKEVLQIYVDKMRDVIFSEWNEKNSNLLFGVKCGWLVKVVNKTLNKVAGDAGYEGFTSHRFRHGVGYHLLRAGCNIRYIQQLLGHELLRNTEIYTKVEKEDLKEVLDTYHPRKWSKRNCEETNSGKNSEDI